MSIICNFCGEVTVWNSCIPQAPLRASRRLLPQVTRRRDAGGGGAYGAALRRGARVRQGRRDPRQQSLGLRRRARRHFVPLDGKGLRGVGGRRDGY